jgi:hypothetical protein
MSAPPMAPAITTTHGGGSFHMASQSNGSTWHTASRLGVHIPVTFVTEIAPACACQEKSRPFNGRKGGHTKRSSLVSLR